MYLHNDYRIGFVSFAPVFTWASTSAKASLPTRVQNVASSPIGKVLAANGFGHIGTCDAVAVRRISPVKPARRKLVISSTRAMWFGPDPMAG